MYRTAGRSLPCRSLRGRSAAFAQQPNGPSIREEAEVKRVVDGIMQPYMSQGHFQEL